MQFTAKQQEIITRSRELMPDNFSLNTTDEKILAYAEVVLSDLNFFPPLTGYTTDNIPENLMPVLFFGISLFTELFLQMRATLEDFDYNDNGLYVRVDQVTKLDQSYKNLLEMYRNMILNFKKTQILSLGTGSGLGGRGLGTPRFQSQIGQFLKIALGGSFQWNSQG